MKKTDLYKKLGLKIDDKLKQAGTPDRFAQGGVLDRKAQRKVDQAKGLIPFAVKLDAQLASNLRELAQKREMDMNQLVDDLIRKGMSI
jgi:PP-loop superfamily ATP-utilizing enzyme